MKSGLKRELAALILSILHKAKGEILSLMLQSFHFISISAQFFSNVYGSA